LPRSAARACPFPGCPHYLPCAEHRAAPRVQHSYDQVLSTPAWRALRDRVLAEEPVCHWCGTNRSTVGDHVVALADGGAPLDRANVVGACNGCNISRGQRAAQARRMANR